MNKKKLQQWVQWGYDRFICTPDRLVSQALRKSKRCEQHFSVAIPHWNRAAFIHRPLWNIVHDERIEEILIVDDGSDEEEFALLVKNVTRYDLRKIVTIHRREKNRGAQFTKMECVKKTSGTWMVLLDSDNTLLPNYLDAISRLQEHDEKTIYCPDWAFPYFSFHPLSGKKIDFQRTCQLVQQGVLQRIYMLNDGNYFFHRKTYLAQLMQLEAIQNDVADVMLANYRWLSRGGYLDVMKGASYIHRIDDSSFWMRTPQQSKERVIALLERLKKNLPWDDAFENSVMVPK